MSFTPNKVLLAEYPARATKLTKYYEDWVGISPDQVGLNPLKVRDLIVECFTTAQKETFLRASSTLQIQTESHETEIQRMVEGSLRTTFKQVGGNYDKPTKKHLAQVVELLAQKAASWGTPPEIVARHRALLTVLIAEL